MYKVKSVYHKFKVNRIKTSSAHKMVKNNKNRNHKFLNQLNQIDYIIFLFNKDQNCCFICLQCIAIYKFSQKYSTSTQVMLGRTSSSIIKKEALHTCMITMFTKP